MYSAYVYDYTQSTVTPICFYTSASSDSRLALSGAKLSLKKNEAGSFGFKMYPDNIGNDHFKTLTSIIEIKKDNQPYWRGRVISEERDSYDNRSITCEGSLNFLLDSVQLPMHVHSGILAWLQYLLTTDYHDSEAPEGQYHRCHNYYYTSNDTYKQFAIKYFDPSIELSEATDWYANYETTGELLKNVLDAYNIKMEVTYENGINNLSFYKDYPSQYISQQTITFGKNLISFTRNWEVDELATVVIPTGSKLDAGAERPTYPYTPPELDCVTTIESVNQGSVFLEADADVIARYGRIYKKIDWSDISEPANLLDLAQDYLQNYQFDGMTIEIEVFDLSLMMTGGERAANQLRLLGTVHCVSQFHGLDKTFPITEMEIDFNNPGNTKFVLGEATDTSLTGTMESNNNATYKAIDANQSSSSEIYNSVETGLDTKIDQKIDTELEPYDTSATIHSWVLSNCYKKTETYTKNEVSTEAAAQAQTYYQNNITGSMSAAVSEAVTQAGTNATAMITGMGSGGGTVFFVHDPNDSTGQKITDIGISNQANYTASNAHCWRWNINGLAYSSTGWNGSYGAAAITADGAINANFITTGSLTANLITAGSMSADRISGGTISSLDSDSGGRHNMVLNLTNGHFFAKNLFIETPSTVTCPSDGYIYLGTDDWSQHSIWSNGSNTITVGGYTEHNWRCILGSHFGVTSDGVVACNYMKAGDILIGGDFVRTITTQGTLGSMGTFVLAGTDTGTLFGTEGTYTVCGVSRNDWRLTIGNYFGVTKAGNLYSTDGTFRTASVDGTIDAGSLIISTIASGNTTQYLNYTVQENNGTTYTRTIALEVSEFGTNSQGYPYGVVQGWIVAGSGGSTGTETDASSTTVYFYIGEWLGYESGPYTKANFSKARNGALSITIPSGRGTNNRVSVTVTGGNTYSGGIFYKCSGVYIKDNYDNNVNATQLGTTTHHTDMSSALARYSVGGTTHAAMVFNCSVAPHGNKSGQELLGAASNVWKQVYLSQSPIVSSSRIHKTNIVDLQENFDIFFDNLRPVNFHVDTDKNYLLRHNGFILDEVRCALGIAGIAKETFAGYHEFDTDGNHLGDGGLCYEEFVAINTWQIQKLKKRVSELEKLVEELERNNNENST